METKKRKKLYNVLMVLIIAVVAVAGIVIAGIMRGYIGNKADCINVKEIYGIAGIDKNGIVYTMDEKANVTEGNTISTKTRARVKLEKNGDTYIIGENSTAVVKKISDEKIVLELVTGEMLVFMSGAGGSSELMAEYVTAASSDGIYSVSARTGTTTVYSFAGETVVGIGEKSETLQAGSYICAMNNENYTADIDIHSLSSFQLSMLIELTAERRLCFTKDELAALSADREGENNYGGGDTVYLDGSILSANADTTVQSGSYTGADLNNNSDENSDYGMGNNHTGQDKPDKEEDKKGDNPDPPPKENKPTENGGTPTTEAGNNPNGNGGHTTENHNSTESTTETHATETRPGKTPTMESTATTEKPTTEQAEATTEHTQTENKTKTCTLEIRCDTILNNKTDLVPGKDVYVPNDGVILRTVKVEFKDGETVFDVLRRTCDAYGIQIEYSYTPLYGSYYIEGINYLYEFDCGSQSGWMYKVNGWFPNYGCSSYVLSDKDTIVWCYTCQGLGADVGGGVY